MSRCEDWPACGHNDGGGCPDEDGRFVCCRCDTLMEKGWGSALCIHCTERDERRYRETGGDPTGQDMYGEDY